MGRKNKRKVDDSDDDFFDDDHIKMLPPKSQQQQQQQPQQPPPPPTDPEAPFRTIIHGWWERHMKEAQRFDKDPKRYESLCPLHPQYLNKIHNSQSDKEAEALSELGLQIDDAQGGVIGGRCCCKGTKRCDMPELLRHAEDFDRIYSSDLGRGHRVLAQHLRGVLNTGHQTIRERQAVARASASGVTAMNAMETVSWPPLLELRTKPEFVSLIDSKNKAKAHLKNVSKASQYVPVYSFSQHANTDNEFKGQIVLMFQGSTEAEQDRLFEDAIALRDECNLEDQLIITSANFLDEASFKRLPGSARNKLTRQVKNKEFEWRKVNEEKARIADAHKRRADEMRKLEESVKVLREREVDLEEGMEAMQKKHDEERHKHERELSEARHRQAKDADAMKELECSLDTLSIRTKETCEERSVARSQLEEAQRELMAAQESARTNESRVGAVADRLRDAMQNLKSKEDILASKERSIEVLDSQRRALEHDRQKIAQALEEQRQVSRYLEAEMSKLEARCEEEKTAKSVEIEKLEELRAEKEELMLELKNQQEENTFITYKLPNLQRAENILDELLKGTAILDKALSADASQVSGRRTKNRFQWRRLGEVNPSDLKEWFIGSHHRFEDYELMSHSAAWQEVITGHKSPEELKEMGLRLPALDPEHAFIMQGGKCVSVREEAKIIEYPPLVLKDGREIQRPSKRLEPTFLRALEDFMGNKKKAKRFLRFLMDRKNDLITYSDRHSGYGAITLAWDCVEHREMTPDQKLAFIVKHTGLEFKSKLLDETAGFEVSSEASSPMEVS